MIRAKVADLIRDRLADETARNEHRQMHHKLYVYPDGHIHWGYEADYYTHLCLDGRPVPILADVGTGSVACDCAWCEEVDDPDDIDWQDDEVAITSDEMIRKLNKIPHGYFVDEDQQNSQRSKLCKKKLGRCAKG